MFASSLPRAFPNHGVWCWVNSLLQTLASIADDRWWDIIDHAAKDGCGDMLSTLAVALCWVQKRGDYVTDKLGAWPVMCAVERALVQECSGLSAGAEQDVHEALLQVLEAISDGLSRRELAAFSQYCRGAGAVQPWIFEAFGIGVGTIRRMRAKLHRQFFRDLWEGRLEEKRLCHRCGYMQIDCRASAQKFRCLSLDFDREGSPWLNLEHTLHNAYGTGRQGDSTSIPEQLEDVYCARCSLQASRRKFYVAAASGSLAALSGYWRADTALRAGHKLDLEALHMLCPMGAPDLQYSKTAQQRTFRVDKSPRLLALHLRRLTYGPYGLVKRDTRVMYPTLLPIHVRQSSTPDTTCCGSDADGLHSPTETNGKTMEDGSSSPARGMQADASATTTEHDDMFSARYGLRSVVSHLGSANSGHFLTHRRLAAGGGIVGASEILPCVSNWLLWSGAAGVCVYADIRLSLQLLRADPFLTAALRLGPRWIQADDDNISEVAQRTAMGFPGTYLLVYERTRARCS
eukprot:TRINITY_DN69837_c0_g1_i1.p1 TRINITY_DN69837_c0_g1~~TRINITY_DN69837_c0_g1_i1.p1  ORF type:complete len:517 (-),score=40.35 TRINITY_DN69837_c0_g1_i1:35-1585(-)